MNNIFPLQLCKTYSEVHAPTTFTNSKDVSFEGSQKQYEFFRAWEKINEFYLYKEIKTLTFLEVGAWKGLWGLAFLEFCDLHNIEGEYVTITMIDHDPNNKPLLKTISYMNSRGMTANLVDMNTLDVNALPEVLKYGTSYNMVFIDAGHAYHEVKNDIEKFAPLATDMLLFHDIRPTDPRSGCGVYQAIADSGLKLNEEIVDSDETMGIGITYIK